MSGRLNKEALQYGVISINDRNVYVHRTSYELFIGPIPTGMQVLHKCDIPPCINPKHLFLGSRFDNMHDSVVKKRHKNSQKTHCQKGHEFTDDNTYKRVDGRRFCKICARKWERDNYYVHKTS